MYFNCYCYFSHIIVSDVSDFKFVIKVKLDIFIVNEEVFKTIKNLTNFVLFCSKVCPSPAARWKSFELWNETQSKEAARSWETTIGQLNQSTREQSSMLIRAKSSFQQTKTNVRVEESRGNCQQSSWPLYFQLQLSCFSRTS